LCAKIFNEVKIPVLGVCLGHQGLGSHFGAKVYFFFFSKEQSKSYFFKQKVIHGNEPMHGRISSVYHFETEEKNHLFENIPSPFSVVRYHSLIISKGKILIKFKYTSKKKTNFFNR